MIENLSVVVINLPRRSDRLSAFKERWTQWFPEWGYTVQEAVDTGTVDGLIASHMAALYNNPGPVLVLEDDAVFVPDFSLDINPPPNWDMLWLGGQHFIAPMPVEGYPEWVRPLRLLRTHAYIARDPRAVVDLAQRTLVPESNPYLSELPLVHYALRRFIVGQAAGSSDMSHDSHQEDQFWNNASPPISAKASS